MNILAVTTTVDIPGWTALFGTVLTIVSVVAAAAAVSRANNVKASVQIFSDANDELRKVNEDQANKLQALERQRTQDAAKYEAQITELRSEMRLITGRVAHEIGQAIGQEIGQAIVVEISAKLAEIGTPNA